MTRAKQPDELTIIVSRMPKAGDTINFQMDEAERERVATALDLVGLLRFNGTLDVQAWQKSGVRVRGDLNAVATHESVVTLEPVERRYRIGFDMIFVPETSKLARPARQDEQELFVDPEGDDPPETFAGDEIVLRPYVEEHLALALDPYPREDGAAFEEIDTDPEPEAGKASPFADLAMLKKQQETDK